jgi:uncharacterized protein YndB with AHSA1/START domain
MSDFDPGPMGVVGVSPVDGRWRLTFVQPIRHPPEKVWAALTDPAQLDQWAPFTAAHDLSVLGENTLTMVDGDTRTDIPITVLRSEPPRRLEYTWGDDLLSWRLGDLPPGTVLGLTHTIARRDMGAMVAAGWHICVAVADRLLAGRPVGVIRGRDALAHGFERLHQAYAKVLDGEDSDDE